MSTTAAPAPAASATTQTTPAPQAAEQSAPAESKNSAPAASAHQEAKQEAAKEKAERAAAEEKYEIKVNGKSRLVTKEELIRRAQLSESASERFETAAQKEKRLEQLFSKMDTNSIEAILELRPDIPKEKLRAQLEEWYSREFIEPESLTPEQRKLKELERENAIYRKMQQEAKEAEERQAAERAEAEYAQHFQNQIIEGMEKHRLPKTKSNVKKVAFYMRQALSNGWEAPMELIIDRVKEDIRAEHSEISNYSYDEFVDQFGEALINKIMAEHLKKVRESRAASGGRPVTPPSSQSSKAGERISMSEVTQRLRAMRLGR